MNFMYSQTTQSIKISVTPFYLEEQSDTAEHHFVWAYTVVLENIGTEVAKLLNRYWHITDATGAVQEVRGAGVVGEQPTIRPEEIFQYSSGVALRTSSGIMTGAYEMEKENGEKFLAAIPAFSLDSPEQFKRPN